MAYENDDTSKPTKLTGKALDDFMALARKRFEQDCADEKELREAYSQNVRFEAGEQWDPKVKADRIKAGRPALTFPRCHTFAQKVANEARQHKAEIKFSPPEPGDDETVEILEGIARQIQYSSDADIAYETAAECQAGGNFGYFRFLTEYCDDETFDQELKVVPVFDPLSIYGVLIPACYGQEPNHAFVIEELTKDEYQEMYPDSALGKDWAEGNRRYSGWVGTETVKIAEYWTVEEERTTLEKGNKSRTVVKKRVKFCKINGVEVLPDSETEWVTYCIPIFPVLGKLKFVDGKPRLFGVISHQIGSQQLINLYKSRIAETIGTAPIQPYMVPKGAITPDVRAQWETLNSVQRPFVEYNVVDLAGKPIPPPQRQVFEPPIAALSEAAAQEVDGMKAAAGVFDASLGAQGNETSGIAIQNRQQESDDVNAHLVGNFGRALESAGKRVLAPAIPKVYDTARTARILGKDMSPSLVKINQPYNKGNKQVHYKVGGDDAAKYDVIVSVGRSFSSKKMESFDMYAQLGQTNPQMAFATSDLMLRNSDMAGADEAADRMKKIIYAQFPFLQEEENDQQPIPPQVQAALQQMQQQLQVRDQVGQQMHQEIEQYKAGAQVKQMELAHKENLEKMKYDFERWKHQTSLGLEDKKVQVGAMTKAEELHSRENIAGLQVAAQMTQHNQTLDAQQVQQAQQAAEQPAAE